jgi:hypothetical protein
MEEIDKLKIVRGNKIDLKLVKDEITELNQKIGNLGGEWKE